MIFSFAQFEERVRDRGADARWVYRGHSSPDWKLETSLLRYCNRRSTPFSLESFFEILDAFIDHAEDFLDADLVTLNLCQRIALAQHHGIPTPFLDWTESPYVAAFFALAERYALPTDEPFSVWAIKVAHPVSDGADITREALLDATEPFRLLRPKIYQSRRLSRQFGLFTFFGRDECLADYLRRAEIVATRYDIAGNQWQGLLSQLQMMGIAASNLFDDLDGVALDTLIRTTAGSSTARL